MSAKTCPIHHEKLVSFCIAPACQLKPLCSLCIVQHLKEVHSISSAFGDIELLNIETFYQKCTEKLEKFQPKYAAFLEELSLIVQDNKKKYSFDKLQEKILGIKQRLIHEINQSFTTSLDQYKEFYEKQNQQIMEKMHGLQDKVSMNHEFLTHLSHKTQTIKEITNSEFSFLQKMFIDSLDLELEKKRNIIQKLIIELQHLNVSTIQLDTLIETSIKSINQNITELLSKTLAKTTANTSLIAVNPSANNDFQPKSMSDIGSLMENSTFLLFNKDNKRKDTDNSAGFSLDRTSSLHNNKSSSNLLTLKTEEDEEEKDNIMKKRSHTPNIQKSLKFNKKNFKAKEKIEELIEEENVRNSICEKKPSIIFHINSKKPENILTTSLSPPSFKQNKQKEGNSIFKSGGITLRVPSSSKLPGQRSHASSRINLENINNNALNCVFPEKNFQNYLIFLRNLSYKKYGVGVFTQDFTRKIASLRGVEGPASQAIVEEFNKKYQEMSALKKKPQELGLIYQDFSGEYFYMGTPWDFSTNNNQKIQGYYLLFDEESEEKLEKFRYFINGVKILLSLWKKNKENEINLKEIHYTLGIPKHPDLIRIALCYHIQTRLQTNYKKYELTVEDLLDFKKKYIS